MVAERILDITRVIRIPRRIIPDRIPAEKTVVNDPVAPPIKNMVMIAIMVGKRPLHGTKLLVIIAMRRSLGESIIRQPTIPAALQPNPMHMTAEIYAFLLPGGSDR